MIMMEIRGANLICEESKGQVLLWPKVRHPRIQTNFTQSAAGRTAKRLHEWRLSDAARTSWSREEIDHSRAISRAEEKFADSAISEELVAHTKRKEAPPSVVQIKHEVDPRGANTQARTHPRQVQSRQLGHFAEVVQSQKSLFALDNEGMSQSFSGAAAKANIALHSTAAFTQSSSLAPVLSVEGYFESNQQHRSDFVDLYPHGDGALSLDSPSRLETALSSRVDDAAAATVEVGPTERIAQHCVTAETPISYVSAGLLDLRNMAVSRDHGSQRDPGRRHDAPGAQSRSQSRSPVREMPSPLPNAQFSSSSSANPAQGSLVMDSTVASSSAVPRSSTLIRSRTRAILSPAMLALQRPPLPPC